MITKILKFTMDENHQVTEQITVYSVFGIPIYTKKLMMPPPKELGIVREYYFDF